MPIRRLSFVAQTTDFKANISISIAAGDELSQLPLRVENENLNPSDWWEMKRALERAWDELRFSRIYVHASTNQDERLIDVELSLDDDVTLRQLTADQNIEHEDYEPFDH